MHIKFDLPGGMRSDGRVAVIGDMHGQHNLFRELVDAIDRPGETELILLGDLVDRGPDSRGCLELARDLENGAGGFRNVVTLPGNHEQMMYLGCLAPRGSWAGNFVANGGALTCEEFDYDIQAMLDALPRQMMSRLAGESPAWHQSGDLLFIHAGIDPHCDPLEFLSRGMGPHVPVNGFSTEAHPLWIRETFLEHRPKHGFKTPAGTQGVVVHGHTRIGMPDAETTAAHIAKWADRFRIPLDTTGKPFAPLLMVEGASCDLHVISEPEMVPGYRL